MPRSRYSLAYETRVEAAGFAKGRTRVCHVNNGEKCEHRPELKPQSSPSHLANWKKGLPHCKDAWLLLNPVDYELFIHGIQSGDPRDFKFTPLGSGVVRGAGVSSDELIRIGTVPDTVWQSAAARCVNSGKGADVRAWEVDKGIDGVFRN